MFWCYKWEGAGSSTSSLSSGFPEVTGQSGFLSNQYFDTVSCWRKWSVPLGSLLMCVCFFPFSFHSFKKSHPHVRLLQEKTGKSFLWPSHRKEDHSFGRRGGGREFFLQLYSDDLMYPQDYLFSIEVIWFHFWEHILPQDKTDFCFVFMYWTFLFYSENTYSLKMTS